MATKKKAVRWRYFTGDGYVMRQCGGVREYHGRIIGKWMNGNDASWAFQRGDRRITPAAARRIIKGGGKC